MAELLCKEGATHIKYSFYCFVLLKMNCPHKVGLINQLYGGTTEPNSSVLLVLENNILNRNIRIIDRIKDKISEEIFDKLS